MMIDNKSQPLMVALAGTHGKTMSGLLLKHILNRAQVSGEGDFIESQPAGKSLSKIIDSRKKGEAGWLALEISPEGLKSGLYNDYVFDLNILINLYPHHQGSMTQHRYLALHRNFLSHVPEKGITMVNADDPLALEVVDAANGKTITYALHYPKAMVTAENYKPFPMGSSFEVAVRGELPRLGSWYQGFHSFPVRVPLPGEVGVYTALTAVTAALVCGVKEESIVQGLKTFSGIKRRLELLPAEDFQVLDDTAPSSLALRSLFGSLTALRFQRIFLVLGIEKGEKRVLMDIAGELLQQEQKQPLAEIFLTTCTEYLPPSKSASQAEEKAFLNTWSQGKGRTPIAVFHSLAASLHELALSLRKGDLVLLLGGKGMNDASRLISQYFGDPYTGQAYKEPAGGPSEQWGLLNPT